MLWPVAGPLNLKTINWRCQTDHRVMCVRADLHVRADEDSLSPCWKSFLFLDLPLEWIGHCECLPGERPEWLPIKQILTNCRKVSRHHKLYEAKINHIIKSCLRHQHLLTLFSQDRTRWRDVCICCTLKHCVKHWGIVRHRASSASLDSVTWTAGFSCLETVQCVDSTLYPEVILLDFYTWSQIWEKMTHSKDLSVSFSSQVHGVTLNTEARCYLSSEICTQSMLISRRLNLKKRVYHWYFFVENIIKICQCTTYCTSFCMSDTCFSYLIDVMFARSYLFVFVQCSQHTHNMMFFCYLPYVWVWRDHGAAEVFFYQ